MIYNNTVTLGHTGEETTFTVVAATGHYDYSWDETAVLKRESDGAMFLAESSGCSCYGFEDNCSLADLVPVANFRMALRKVGPELRNGLERSRRANGESVNLYEDAA